MRKEFQIALGKLISKEYGSNWDLPQVEKKVGGFEAKLVVFNQPKEKIFLKFTCFVNLDTGHYSIPCLILCWRDQFW